MTSPLLSTVLATGSSTQMTSALLADEGPPVEVQAVDAGTVYGAD